MPALPVCPANALSGLQEVGKKQDGKEHDRNDPSEFRGMGAPAGQVGASHNAEEADDDACRGGGICQIGDPAAGGKS